MNSATFLLSDLDIICIDCDQPLPPGAPIGEKLTDMSSAGTGIYELVCVYCAMGLK